MASNKILLLSNLQFEGHEYLKLWEIQSRWTIHTTECIFISFLTIQYHNTYKARGWVNTRSCNTRSCNSRHDLHMNKGKTKYLFVDTPIPAPLVSSKGCAIEEVEDFVYLGSWVASSEYQPVSSYCRVYPTLWLWDMDHHCVLEEKYWWLLHNALDGPRFKLERP